MRLMELFNITINTVTDSAVTASYASESYEDVRKIKVQLIQWIPKGAEYQTEVVQQDATVVQGYAEVACKKLKADDIIQFERFGFVRVNEVGEETSRLLCPEIGEYLCVNSDNQAIIWPVYFDVNKSQSGRSQSKQSPSCDFAEDR